MVVMVMTELVMMVMEVVLMMMFHSTDRLRGDYDFATTSWLTMVTVMVICWTKRMR